MQIINKMNEMEYTNNIGQYDWGKFESPTIKRVENNNQRSNLENNSGNSSLSGTEDAIIQLISVLIDSINTNDSQQQPSRPSALIDYGARVTSSFNNIPRIINDGTTNIPSPQTDIQALNLGGKPVIVGGDGTGSVNAREVKAVADSILHLYNNSPTFRAMIDTSSDPMFEATVGRRDDNMSWGNAIGKTFININSIDSPDNEIFQELLGHEFAHASIDLGHGTLIEQIQKAVAQEA